MEVNENECLARKYQVADYAGESIKSIRKIGSLDCDSTSTSADRGTIICLGTLYSEEILYPWDFSCTAQQSRHTIHTWQSRGIVNAYFQARKKRTHGNANSREWFMRFTWNKSTIQHREDFFIIKINIFIIKLKLNKIRKRKILACYILVSSEIVAHIRRTWFLCVTDQSMK